MTVDSGKYFSKEELECPCCGECKMDPVFIERLDSLRWKFNQPIVVNSAYRCNKHNKEVGGVKGSAHTKGLAVDIKIPDSQARYKLMKYAFWLGFMGIGVGDNFLHVDDVEEDPRPNSWTY